MLIIKVEKQTIDTITPEEFIRGTVGATCEIQVDEFWKDFQNFVVFKRDGLNPFTVAYNGESTVNVPHQILFESGSFKIGFFGVTDEKVLPTLWSEDFKIRYGSDTHGTTPPEYEPNELDYLFLNKQDKLTAGIGIKISEDNVISAVGSGAGGTTDYESLENLPKINGVELVGNKSTSDLGIEIPTKLSELDNDKGFVDNTSLGDYYTKSDVDGLLENYWEVGDAEDILQTLDRIDNAIEIDDKDTIINSPSEDTFLIVGNDGITFSSTGAFDVDQANIVNLGDPINATDAVNKRYVDTIVGDIETLLGGI